MKTNLSSQIDEDRKNNKHQVDDQRNAILDAAEVLFLQNGLNQTTMVDIARKTGIHKVTLYRYFPDRDTIAFEIAVRMLGRIGGAIDTGEHPLKIEIFRNMILRMIDQFYALRDAFRYIGMFDHLYGASYPNEKLAAWYKEQILELGWDIVLAQKSGFDVSPNQVAMIGNSAMSFLEKMAARGELMSAEQEVSMDEELSFFKDMVNAYFDTIVRKI